MISINASDKQIEIAFKTNDVFSSQDDMDELPALIMNSPPQKSLMSKKKQEDKINLTD